MSQEKVNAYKDKKAERKSSDAKKKQAGKTVRTVVFYAVLVLIVGGTIWSIANMVGSYTDSIPNYDATDCIIYDYASATTTAAEDEEDLYESLVDEGAISVEDGGEVVVEDSSTEASSETTVETTAE